MTTKERVQKVLEEMSTRLYLVQKDGLYTYTFSPARGDCIDEKAVAEICLNDDPHEAFEDWVQEGYVLSASNIQQKIVDRVMEIYPEEKESDVTDEVMENLQFDFPYDYFAGQELQINVVVDTGDKNELWPRERIGESSSLAWLANAQGYSYSELEKAMHGGKDLTGSNFLKTVREEIDNLASSRNELTFLVTMDVKSVVEIYSFGKEKVNASLHIPKEATCGMYDPQTGAGSLFEIKLEKDLSVPIAYIYSAMPDKVQKTWTVSNAYAMSGKAWNAKATLVAEGGGDE